MKNIRLFIVAAITLILFSSHDMFLKFDNYFLKPNTDAVLQLFNGTFEKSDNSIDRNRMQDVSLVANGNRTRVEASQWFVKDSITFLNFKTGNAGTQVIGVSTKPRDFEMEAKKFNDYLKNDGVIDILEDRKINNKLEQNAFEKYSKHVKTIFQVGDELTDDWSVNLGYPIEFIPLENPYEIHTGHSLPVKLLRDGKPLANHFVYVGHKPNANHSHEHEHNGEKHNHEHGEDDADHQPSHDANNHSHEHEHNGAKHSHEHGEEDANHQHSHGAKKHSHEYEHNGEKHSHEHGEDDADHKHNHDAKNHSHEHNHNGEKHSHEHGKDDADHKHSHDKNAEEGHVHDKVSQLKTDENGVVNVDINAEGTWFLRTIHMTELDDEKLTHESNWATLTFGIGEGLGHSHDDVHSHEDEHDHDDEGFSSYVFWIGSIILVGILFFLFNRKK